MNKEDPRYVEKFVALVRAAEEDEFRDVPDERLRAAVQGALAEHPEDAWTDGTFTQVGAAFFFCESPRADRLGISETRAQTEAEGRPIVVRLPPDAPYALLVRRDQRECALTPRPPRS